MKSKLIVHPFLFGAFPVLFLYSHNANELPVNEIVSPLLVISAVILFLWPAVSLLTRDVRKAGIIVSFLSLFFFSFGAIRDFLNRLNLFGTATEQTFYLLPLWATVLVIVLFTIIKTKHQLHRLTAVMNVIALVLTAIPASMAVYSHAARDRNVQKIILTGKTPEIRPDIYYIILDGYARPDILKKLYNYDNREFIVFLRKRGFYVADKSTANYCQTPLSLASSLNFEFLDDALRSLNRTSHDARPLIEMIHESNVSSFLRKNGYKIAAFSSGYAPTDIKTSDIYLSPRWCLDEFDNALINSTPVPLIMEKFAKNTFDDLYRGNISFIFEKLPSLPLQECPKFVFAHITSPHEPFVFGRNGEPLPPDGRFAFGISCKLNNKSRTDYISRYRDQAIFTENRIKSVIDGILSKSRIPPVIIIQSDHGPHAFLDWFNPKNPGLTERMSIFNAYYLPGKNHNILYREISPVNTFRVIFKYYFGADLELLKDMSNFSTPLYPYQFTDVSCMINIQPENE